jgi:hypothetical protein
MPQNPPEGRRIGHCVNTLADSANVTGPALGAPSGEVGGLQRAKHEIRETCVSSSRYP